MNALFLKAVTVFSEVQHLSSMSKGSASFFHRKYEALEMIL